MITGFRKEVVLMYKVGDTVYYGAQGVCKIESESDQKFGKEVKKYLVLKPVYDNRNTIFVPTDNEKLYSKIQNVLEKQELLAILDDIVNQDIITVENNHERKDKLKQILAQGDRMLILRLIKTMYSLRDAKFAQGKRLPSTDEYILKDAEKLFCCELAFVVDIQFEEALAMIKEKI